MYLPSFSLILIPASLILLFYKEMHKELLLGFFFILTLSDSRLASLSFAANVKNIYIVLFAIFFLFENKKINFKIPFINYIIPFLAVAFYCLQFSPIFSVSFQKTLSYGLLFLVIPNYVSMALDKYGTYFLKDIIWFVVVLLLVGIVLNFFDPLVTNLVGRYRGILGNPNGLGIYVTLFTILFHTIVTLYKGLFNKKEILFIYLLCFLNLYMCGARSSLIATILFLFLSNFYKIDKFLGFLIFIILLFSYQFISSNIDSIILSLGMEKYFRLESLENGSGRLVAWALGWQNIQKHFFVGLGFNYTEYLYKLNYAYLSKLNHQGAAHNTYLTFWLDTGLVGLIAFLSGFVALFYKIRKVTSLVFPILYAVLLSNQFESWLTASLNPFTIQLIIIISIIYYKGFRGIENEEKMDNEIAIENEDPIPIH